MLNLLIVDDEINARQILRQMVIDYCPHVNIVDSVSSAEEAYTVIKHKQPNLLLLDIFMPSGGDGFDLLERLAQELPNYHFEVIFVTGYNKYAVDAFKYSAVHFLLKPVKSSVLIEAIQRAEERLRNKHFMEQLPNLLYNLQNPNNKRLAIPTRTGKAFLDTQDIIHCEADGSDTIIHLKDQSAITTTKHLGKLADTFSSHHSLFRCHQSHIISIKKVVALEDYSKGRNYGGGGNAVMVNKNVVPISRRRFKDFMDLFNQLH